MRTLIVPATSLLLYAFSLSSAFAQAPDLLSFQGYLTDSEGMPIDTPSVSMTFKIYEGTSAIWTEHHPSVAVNNGTFNALLGGTTSLSFLPFDEPYWLGITIGEDSETSPRTRLAAAPFAKALPGFYTYYGDGGNAKSYNVVGGGSMGVANVVGTGVTGATISGGGGRDQSGSSSPNSVLDYFGTVSGGESNTAGGLASTVGGGSANTADDTRSTVAGGSANTANGVGATVGGGIGNTASPRAATVSGGESNTANGQRATVGGGWSNSADSAEATVAGGNTNTASGWRSAIGGGSFNSAQGSYAVVTGGDQNTASGGGATVGGGRKNTATGLFSTVPGGVDNGARGLSSYAAGDGARAIHDGTFVWNDRTFTSGPNDSLVSTGDNQFIVRAEGGFAIGTNTPRGRMTIWGPNDHLMGPGLVFVGASGNQIEAGRIRFMDGTVFGNHRGAYIHYDASGNDLHIGVHDETDSNSLNDIDIITIERASGDVGIKRADPAYPLHVGTNGANGNGAHVTVGGTWVSTSSRTLKEDMRLVDHARVLEDLTSLPIYSWRYSNSDEGVHMGPVAEDFYEAFELGKDDRYIAAVDGDGVALAAIQGLYELVKEQQAEIERMREVLIRAGLE